jgi:acyl transferase domain-containing protein/NADP-dependent 3-hydroxy acid dehydrogenase YdfG
MISGARDAVMGITPFSEPNADLAIAVERAGCLGVLDLGSDAGRARRALNVMRRRLKGRPFGVRLSAGCPLGLADLPPEAGTVLVDLAAGDAGLAARTGAASATDSGTGIVVPGTGGRRVIAEVTSPEEAQLALRRGADGLLARGFEGGGRIGELSTFMLVQLLAAAHPDVPVWAAGGIGPRTAAAAVAGGARGVAVDAQLALTAETEAELPADVTAAITAMDGSETKVITAMNGRYRVYTRPGLPDLDPAPGNIGARGLGEQILPVGQDGAFARPLAARYKTAGGVVTAIADAIASQIQLAAALTPVRDTIPVQGPMTRVSDRAEFAAAVSAAGGLPFLALALMPGDQVTTLLHQTRAALAGLDWGVGILGFAPPGLRDEQLRAILDVRPPYAIIAGGRPSQAKALEQAGIETFLHVPSPGLLDQFLKDGARRFVFEGAECGGHIGPRGSFALWEAQITRLLEQPDLDGTEIWFAGGVHDERSAAMVAAMAAPLVQRGARISVVMGTAYLFTSEITASGAVVPLYQRAALNAGNTALLESSPGHVIRVADTPYVTAFAEAKRRLGETGASPQETWAELEQLSLGRLRVAAKGLRRATSDDGSSSSGAKNDGAKDGDGTALVPVTAAEAERDGMFMLGQAAALHDEVTSARALHERVTRGATEFLANRAAGLGLKPRARASADADTPDPLDVAIVGMACFYPGADGAGQFWSNVVAGTDSVTGVPAERWDQDTYPGVPAAKGGFLPRIPFDALKYGIPPGALASIEPVQLLSLEAAARALKDAGYEDRPFSRERTSVIFGTEPGSDLSGAYGLRSILPAYTEAGALPDSLDAHLPRLTEDSFPGVLGNVISGRVANRLDLGGVNYTVDAACASSLAALDLACKELAGGTSDMVLCGGADAHNGIHDYEMFASVHALSPGGRCATFDKSADGIALGEGVACVVLKRLADAERDGDRIYAVVKSVAGSSDGRSLGLTAPRPEGQRRALDRAYARAGISPKEIGLIEAHGTGTVAGDRAELATLTTMFTEHGAAPGATVIGSVKSQIGHTKCAAGLAGLIKVASALYTGTRPGTLHVTEPTGYWDPETSPFTFAGRLDGGIPAGGPLSGGPLSGGSAAGGTNARPWAVPPERRHAGVSAFGFGGTNFHTVLSAYDGADEPRHGLRDWPAELIVFRGDPAAARRALRDLVAQNEAAGRPWTLAEIAATMAARPGPVIAAFTADDLDDLSAQTQPSPGGTTPRTPLGTPDGEANIPGMQAPQAPDMPVVQPGKVAFLFPGQGSQRPGMTGDLLIAFPRLQRILRDAGPRYAEVMFPPAAFTTAERKRAVAAITDTRMAQPTLGIADSIVHEMLRTVGIYPDMAAGHSYGELVALHAAGAFTQDDLRQLSAIRAQAILDAVAGNPGDDPGAMAAVTAPAAEVTAALATPETAPGTTGDVIIANYNSPKQTVLSGATAAIESAVERLRAAGLAAKRLNVAAAFHSPLVADAATALARALADTAVEAPRFPVFANSTAAPYPDDPQQVRRVLSRQVAEPVRFAEQIEAMYAAGARVFVEAGPGRVLSGLVAKILGDRPHTVVACDVPGENGLRRFLSALAELVNAGVAVDPAPLFAQRARPVPGPARQARWTVDGHLVRTADGQPVAGGLRPATEAPRVALAAAPAQASAGTRDEIVTEFLRTTRELVAAQREVVLAYLGAAPAPAGPLPAAPGTVVTGDRPSSAERPVASPPAPGSTIAGGTPAAASRAEITEAVVSVVSTRTGYPADMLGTHLDLEADLSVDSIKRTEIIAALASQLGLTAAGEETDDSVIEELATIKTIDGITDWLSEHGVVSGGAIPPRPPLLTGCTPSPVPPGPPQAGEHPVTLPRAGTGTPRRFVVEPVGLPPAAGDIPRTRGRFLIVDDGRGVALELAELLEKRGAQTITTDSPSKAELAGADALVHLAALRPGGRPVLPAAFEAVRDALLGGVAAVLLVTCGGGRWGRGRALDGEPADLGVAGLARTIAAEYPDVLARAVDVDPKDSPRAIAAQLLAELTDPDGPPVTGYQAGTRTGLAIRETPAPGTDVPDLKDGGVVLLTGGARGITANIALALARATGCHVELLGRSAAPANAADPELDAAPDQAALRSVLIGRGLPNPREIEAETARILADREMRATFDGLRASAASVRYHAVDVRDATAVGAVLQDVYARHGRIDGVIHGAGVLEDKLIGDKAPESFARVYATKVDGARALLGGLRDDVRFVALFGSVSGVFGNRGQADYSAANDALDTLAHMRAGQGTGRVVSVDWGPWAGAGMVSPELEREYARRGVTLIDLRAGVAALLSELADPSGPAQVVYMCDEVPSA